MDTLIAGAKKLGLELNQEQLEQFEIYYRELIEWNRRMNLTSITGYEEVQLRHFLDSLTLTQSLRPPVNNLRIIDVGTGAGIPGIPIKILFPDISLTLLDATAKKAAFVNHIIERLGLSSVEVVAGRAEEAAHRSEYREKFDIVLSRAVAPLATLIELTLPFCAIGGFFIAQKKGQIEEEISLAGKAISLMGGKLREVKRIELEEFTDERWLVVIDKITTSPAQYPRRPGIPAKRPLL